MNRRSVTPAVMSVLAASAAMLLVARVAQQRRALATVPGRRRCRVVVLGAGFGGLNAALLLVQSDAIELTVIDVQNHHLFQPLLYQVATAALSPANIASPVRDVIPALPRTHVIMGAVTGIDTRARHVVCSGQLVPYDELIVATGSQPSYFGNDHWAASAPGLKRCTIRWTCAAGCCWPLNAPVSNRTLPSASAC